MATAAMIALATTTLGASASSVTFSSIPADYRDLILFADYEMATTGPPIIRFNGDSGANYSRLYMGGNGGVQNGSGSTGTSYEIGYFAGGDRVRTITQIMDYSTDKYKTVLDRINNTGTYKTVVGMAARWGSTSAITSIYYGAGTNFAAGSIFSLFGIKGEL